MQCRAGHILVEGLSSAAYDCITLMVTSNGNNENTTDLKCYPVQWSNQMGQIPTSLSQQIQTCHSAGNWFSRKVFSGFGGYLLSRILARLYRLINHRPATSIPHGCRLEITTPRLARDLGAFYEHVTAIQKSFNEKASGPIAVPSAQTCGVDHTQEYIDWRYADYPEHDNIRVLAVRDGEDDLVGAAVIFVDAGITPTKAFVEDMITLPGCNNIVRTLLSAALMVAGDREADLLITAPGKSQNRNIMDKLGFEWRITTKNVAIINIPENVPDNVLHPDQHKFLAENLEIWHGQMF